MASLSEAGIKLLRIIIQAQLALLDEGIGCLLLQWKQELFLVYLPIF